MIDKHLIELLLQDHYICKRSCRDKRYSYALYSGNMDLKGCISTKQFKRFDQVLKESKNRFTLNLTKVRGQHGKSISKQLYKKSKKMKQSIFKKEVFATGSQGTVKAEIVATMNYTSKTISCNHPSTHDDYVKNLPVHKVEVFINGKVWEKELELTSELMLYNEAERLIKFAQEHCEFLATSEPIKTFGEKMSELFS